MKKHQLLEKAMRDYPAGTKFISVFDKLEIESTGIFYITTASNRQCAAVRVFNEAETNSDNAVYTFHTMEWATIISKPKQDGEMTIRETTRKTVLTMTSEDGVTLYEGGLYHEASNISGGWIYCDRLPVKESNIKFLNDYPNKAKAFSTKEAATKWCEEQNRPVAIDVRLFNRSERAVVVKNGVTISLGGSLITLAHSDIEDIQNAINQLNCYKTTSK